MIVTRTHVKTFTILSAWASTTPADYGDMPRVGDPCSVPRCRAPFVADETVYAVTESGGPDAPEPVPCRYGPLTTEACGHAEQWVCGRHVDPRE